MGAGASVSTGSSHTFKRSGIADEPDLTRLIFRELDVTPSFGLHPNDAYDLALFAEQGSTSRGVLVVTMVIQLQFEDGLGTKPGDEFRPLVWTKPDKQKYADDFKKVVTQVWEKKHRLKTTSSIPQFNDIAVRFDIQTIIDDFTLNDHWEPTVTKVDAFNGSHVVLFTGNAQLDSLDVIPVSKGAPSGAKQTPCAHEVGHMLGLKDEYINKETGKAEDNPNFTSDNDSIMSEGDVVRERHYANFADWLNQQFETASKLANEKIEFKVNGTLSASNAKLE